MSEVEREMHIRLSREQTKSLLKWARKITTAHIDADCEPPGYDLHIAIGGGYPSSVEAISGSSRLDLGDVDVDLLEVE